MAKDAIQGLCMFFAGLILLIPHRIGMSRVNYVIKRYNLPISRAGLLLYKFHNPIEVSLTIGTLLGNIINWTVGGLGWPMLVLSICMIIFLFLMLLSSIYMYRIYIVGSDYGHLNSFYFSLILITLFDGFSNAFAFGINAAFASTLAAGIPTSGALVSLLHNLYKFFSDLFHWDDFDYHVLRLQLLINIYTILLSLILWAVDLGLNQTSGDAHKPADPIFLLGLMLVSGQPQSAGDDGHLLDWSPIGMLAISLGTVYAFYPSIAPYSIIDYQYASVIELWILIISAIPTLVIAVLDLITKYVDNFKYGPGGKIQVAWENSVNFTNSGSNCTTSLNNMKKKHRIIQNWNNGYNKPTSTAAGTPIAKYKGWLWHLVWLGAIPYILCIQIFMSMLHYPNSFLSQFFYNHPYVIGFISVLFNTVRETMQAVGFSGAGKQIYDTGAPPTIEDVDFTTHNTTVTGKHTAACNTLKAFTKRWTQDPPDEKEINGTIAATNKLITLFVMMLCVFTGDGYLQHYRRCCRDCWPTTGFTRGQSFRYWLRYGFKGGSKSFTTSFTDMYHRNIRPQIISYA